MAKTKITLKEITDLLKNADTAVSTAAKQALGDLTVGLMKQKIEKGISPIEGNGRFPAYKDPKKYPGKRTDFPNKRPRPVNLELSGKFLDKLKAKVSAGGRTISVGFFDSYGKKLEQGHREGANGQKERPIIPDNSEQLAKSIRLAILRTFEQSVRRYLRGR